MIASRPEPTDLVDKTWSELQHTALAYGTPANESQLARLSEYAQSISLDSNAAQTAAKCRKITRHLSHLKRAL